MSEFRIPRRTFLKGLGTAMALPLLEVMTPTTASAAGVSAAPPVRMAFLFVPNGMSMPQWTPSNVGTLELPPLLQPLKDVQSHVNVLTGLTQKHAEANGDGPGDHARSSAAWLTGVQPKKTAGSDIRLGISVDQVAAMSAFGRQSRFPSLELGCEGGGQSGDCDSGYSCAYSGSISWKSETTPVAKETNPRAVFERLFGSVGSEEVQESKAIRQMSRRSVLDFVLDDAMQLRDRLGARDKQKMEDYFQAVREVELRVLAAEKESREVSFDLRTVPTGAPRDRAEHIRLMGDMMILAFQTDLTRVCTFMFANEGSNRAYHEVGITDGHHEISHHGNAPDKLQKKAQIDAFHVQQLAYVLNKMKSIKEGSGTLLDNSLIVYGAGISDGDRHNHDTLPILTAGNAGGRLKTNRHIVYPNYTPLNNLYISMLDWAGVRVEKLGDSNGQLQGLF